MAATDTDVRRAAVVKLKRTEGVRRVDRAPKAVDTDALFDRTMRRFPKTMARLAE